MYCIHAAVGEATIATITTVPDQSLGFAGRQQLQQSHLRQPSHKNPGRLRRAKYNHHNNHNHYFFLFLQATFSYFR
jgi:hypothetical protein